MTQSEIEKTDNANRIYYGALVIVLILTFILFVPKIASRIFPQKRAMLWNDFKSQTLTQGFDVKKFWQFREFYSPGYFRFSKDVPAKTIAYDLSKFGITSPQPVTTELRFHSPLVISIDTLTTQATLSAILAKSQIDTSHPIFQDSMSGIYQIDPQHVVITFLVPHSQMVRAYGYYDYNDVDKELVKGKYWFDITRITLQ